MRITKSKLAQIIQEELRAILAEQTKEKPEDPGLFAADIEREPVEFGARWTAHMRKTWRKQNPGQPLPNTPPESWRSSYMKTPAAKRSFHQPAARKAGEEAAARGKAARETRTFGTSPQPPGSPVGPPMPPGMPPTGRPTPKATGPSTGGKDVRFQKARVVKAWKALKAAAAADPKAGGDWKKLPYRHKARRAVRDANKNLKAAKAGFTFDEPRIPPLRDAYGETAQDRAEAEAMEKRVASPIKETTITEDLLKRIIKEELGN